MTGTDETQDDATGITTVPDLLAAVARCYPRLRGLVHDTVRRVVAQDDSGTRTNPPTALTDELVERILQQRVSFRSDDHLLALAGTLAARVVVDDERRRRRAKRGGGHRGQVIPAEVPASDGESVDGSLGDAIRIALTRFSEEYPRPSEVAALRLLFDLPIQRIAEAMEISTATVERDWRFARAWLAEALEEHGLRPPPS